jgi:hypothetical protein
MKPELLVLHGTAIKKHGTAAEIAAVVAMEESKAADLLQAAVETGRVSESGGKYTLTPAAAMTLKTAYARAYAAQRNDEAFMNAYERFEKINITVKDLISAWQTLDVGGVQMPNDHSDPEHDQKIIHRLGDLHERAEPILQDLARGLPRLARYEDALQAALEKAEDGEIQWVSDARIESYHTVWFELHEDILRIVGREREEH